MVPRVVGSSPIVHPRYVFSAVEFPLIHALISSLVPENIASSHFVYKFLVSGSSDLRMCSQKYESERVPLKSRNIAFVLFILLFRMVARHSGDITPVPAQCDQLPVFIIHR